MLREPPIPRLVGVKLVSCVAAAAASAFFVALASAQTDDPALRSYQAATGLLSRGMDEMAIAEYRRFLGDNPSHARVREARYGLGLALSHTKDFAGAEKELTAIGLESGLSGFEFAAESMVLLAQCRLAQDRPREAAEALEFVIRELPTHQLADDAAALRVEALYRAGEYTDADRAAGELLQKWKDSSLAPRAAYFAGLSRMAGRDWSGAADRFEAVAADEKAGELAMRARVLSAQARQRAGQFEQAERLYRAALEDAAAAQPEALLGLAQVLHQRAGEGGDETRSREAAQLLDRLLRDYGDSSAGPEACLLRARLYVEAAEYDRARRLLDKLAASSDAGASAIADGAAYWRAKCELRAGKPDDAAAVLRRAIDEYPKSELLAEMRYDLAVALARGGDIDGAAAQITEFVETYADHRLAPDALYLGASNTHQQEKYDASLDFCERFASKFGTSESAPAIAFLRAENLLLAGREAEAREAYRAILEREADGEYAERAAFRLGSLLAGTDAKDEAAAMLSRVAKGDQTAESFRSALLHLGEIALASGNWADAERRFEEFLSFGDRQAGGGADDALLKLGLCRQRQGRHERAIEAFDRLLREFKESAHRRQAMFERGQSLAALGRESEAASAFERVLVESQAEPAENAVTREASLAAYAHQHLGAIALRASRFDDAVLHLSRAAELGAGTPLEGESKLLLGRALAAAGRNDEAATVLAEAAESATGEGAPEATARQAIAMSRAGRHEEAVGAIEQAQRRYAGRIDPALAAALAYERAWCLRELGRRKQAADALTELLRASPPPPGELRWHAACDLADLLLEENRFAPAVELLEPLWSGSKADAPAELRQRGAYQLGVCAYRMERFDQAVEFMREHLRSEGDDPAVTASAELICAESLLKLGKQRQAVEHLRRITEEFADDAACGPALLRLGEALAAMQDWAASERAYSDYLTKFGDSEVWFQAHFGLGMARENQRRFDDAIESYREVTIRHQGPTAARAQFQIGECLFAQKKHEEAAAELLKVDILYAYPEWSAAALYEAGRCFEELKQIDTARKQFEAVVQGFGDTRWAGLARQRLEATRTSPVPGR